MKGMRCPMVNIFTMIYFCEIRSKSKEVWNYRYFTNTTLSHTHTNQYKHNIDGKGNLLVAARHWSCKSVRVKISLSFKMLQPDNFATLYLLTTFTLRLVASI